MDNTDSPAYGHKMATEDNRSDLYAKTLIAIVGTGAILAYALWLQTGGSGPLPLSRKIGFVLAVSGFVCWAAARIQLSRSFSITAKAMELVTSGIYSRIRNPVYIFGTIYIAGLILTFDKPLWLFAILVIVPMQVMRARKEAQVLEEKFGDAYRAYRAKTWF